MVRLNGSTASSSSSEHGWNENSNKSKEQMDRGQKISHYCRSLIGCSVVVRQGRAGTRPERCQRPSLRALHGLRAVFAVCVLRKTRAGILTLLHRRTCIFQLLGLFLQSFKIWPGWGWMILLFCCLWTLEWANIFASGTCFATRWLWNALVMWFFCVLGEKYKIIL